MSYYPPPSGGPPAARAQKIKTYHGSIGMFGLGGPAEKHFKKDAAKLARQGWRVANVTQSGMLAGKPRNITAVYER